MTRSCMICDENLSSAMVVKDKRFAQTPDKEFEILECNLCGLGHTDPVPDDLDKYYFSDYYDQLVFNTPSKLESIQRWYEQKVSPSTLLPDTKGKLLAVGCGPGQKLAELSKKGWNCVGIELDPEACQYAREEYNLTVHNGTLPGNLSEFNKGEFDVVLYDHVFEHLLSPREDLDAAAKVLDQKGSLIIEVPNFGSLSRYIFNEFWGDHDVPRHIFHYTPKSLKKLTSEFGFELADSEYDGSPSLPAGWFTDCIKHHYDLKIPTGLVYPLFVPYGVVTKHFQKSRFRHRYDFAGGYQNEFED